MTSEDAVAIGGAGSGDGASPALLGGQVWPCRADAGAATAPALSLVPADPADDLGCAEVSASRASAKLAPWKSATTRSPDIEDVVHAAADQHYADALVLQPLDEVEHPCRLRSDRERRGRLVHDRRPWRIEGGGAGDGDRLALAARQLLDLLVDALHTDRAGTRDASRPAPGKPVIDRAERPMDRPRRASRPRKMFSAMFRFSGQRQVLVDHLDAEIARLARTARTGWAALERQLPLARHVEAARGIFINVDLPAPLSLARRRTSTLAAEMELEIDPRSAVTAPKYLEIPLLHSQDLGCRGRDPPPRVLAQPVIATHAG